jgi:hypothetical protein
MFINIILLLTALFLSGIAGYYSVVGMAAIFSAAWWPVVIMMSTLEFSKIVVASWLYRNWNNIPVLLKTYLTGAVVVLMFITSMGIFGFLSRAHIEQTSSSAQVTAQIERLEQEIDSQNKIVEMSNKRLNDIMTVGQGTDAGLNARITQANRLIENANNRIKPLIDDQQRIIDQEKSKIDASVAGVQSQISDIDQQVAALDEIVKGLVDQQRSVLAQRKRTEQAAERAELYKKKDALIKQIDTIRNTNNPVIDAANAEIAKIRQNVELEIKQARDLINELTTELGKNIDVTKTQTEIDDQNLRIKNATARLNEITEEKFKLETQNRQLEVEVGPIKYIAEMVYGNNPDRNLLEQAVRWVIILIIFVFDPLAVLMIIAANLGLMMYSNNRPKSSNSTDEPVENQQSSQKKTLKFSWNLSRLAAYLKN